MTLAEFLLARISDDEEIARLALAGEGDDGRWGTDGCRVEGVGILIYDEGGHDEDQADHIARWDPARVLAECEARRRAVEEHPPTDPYNHEGDRYCRRCLAEDADTGYPDEWVQAFYPCPTLRFLALPYAGHPDYRPEWKS